MRDFTEPTTQYWQSLESDIEPGRLTPPFRLGFPARLPDGKFLMLPIRRLEAADRAVASFIANHASFAVLDALAAHMATTLAPLDPDVILGLPTLGLALAPPLARLMGKSNFVPLGYSRKFWYQDSLSEPVTSITTTSAGRRLFVDPNLVPRLAGKRVVVVDDTISSGTTAITALRLMQRAGADVVGLAFAMSQGRQWGAALAAFGADWPGKVSFVFESPHLRLTEEGWVPV
ncbi:Adenine/guanine phosphoribosyltransferase [Rhizobiales bacterium GAS188]|nr:Adenine/guanine phosphoribosyltransferase [Rhizobiales bacterium GAS188]